jgi:Holliday junction resolvase RusA-like endonuclease
MIRVIRIDLAIVAKPRMTRSDRWKKRPCVVRYWKMKDKLVAEVAAQNFKLGDAIHMEFMFEMPKSWSKKKKEGMLGEPHKSKPDLDNCIKSIGDCLKDEDKTIYEITARKCWSDVSMIKLGNKW